MLEKYYKAALCALIVSVLAAMMLAGFGSFGANGFDLFLIKISVFFIATFIVVFVLFEMFAFRKMRMLQEKTNREILKMKDLEKYRREFIGDVSHELKTPIFAIEGFIETLMNGALDDPKVNQRFLGKALKHAERLSSLVQDILTLSQVETGELTMHIEPFSIYELIRETIDYLEPKFTKKGRNILCLLQANHLEPAIVIADRQRIQQVLVNLIDNAVKYGDSQGIVTVEMSLAPNEKIVVKVNDKGPGIAEEHLARLFERFYRVDKSRSREKGGTGLGLAICKHLVEAHKEKIWVESKPGEGATFFFSLKMDSKSTAEVKK